MDRIPASKLVLHTKAIKYDEIVEIKIWEVTASKDKPHGVKFTISLHKKRKRLLAL